MEAETHRRHPAGFPLPIKVTPKMSSTETPRKAVRLSSLKADIQKEREGDWIAAIDIDPSIEWLVRSTNYPPFRIARDARVAKLVRTHGDKIPDEVSAEVFGKLAVEHLLLGWKGLVDDDEKEILFTAEMAADVLTDDAYRRVRGSVYAAASRVGTTEVDVVEQTAKN